MSNLLNEKCALAKLRAELEGRKGKLCRSCKGFGHLAQNCRNRKEEKKGAETPQNKFEVLKSQVMQCGVEERIVRSVRAVRVKCFKYREKGHKCRKCPLWIRRKKGEKAACVARPQEVQQGEWRRSSWETLRKRAEWYYGPTVPQDAELWELGWHGQGAVVTYLKCPRCDKGGCYAEDDRGQRVLPYWKREKISWCGCKGGKEQSSVRAGDSRSVVKEKESSAPTKRKSTAKEGGS